MSTIRIKVSLVSWVTINFFLHLAIILTVRYAHPYILLTANLEDVQEIAKQIVSSPVAGTLNNILRRASNIFSQHVGGYGGQKRADDDLDNDEKHDQYTSRNVDVSNEGFQGSGGDNHVDRRANGDEEFVALGKNASQYLQTIKQIFEKAKTV